MFRFYVLCRWMRLTVRRYGIRALRTNSLRSRHAGVGRGKRFFTAWDSAHGKSTGYQLYALDLVRSLQRERALA